MSKEQLIHIFDNSTCLTKRQLKDYVGGTMTNEEAHAAEVHLNTCPMCSDAVEGLFEKQEGSLAAMTELNTDFLKDHFGLHNPQIHLNSIAAAHTHSGYYHATHKKKAKVQPLWRTAAIAATLLLMVGAFWYYRFTLQPISSPTIANDVIQPAPENNTPSSGNEMAIAMATETDDDKKKQKETKDTPAETTAAAPAAPEEQQDSSKPGFFKRMTDKAQRMVEEKSTATVLNAMKDPEKTKYETSARNQQNDEQRAVPKGVEDEAVVVQQYKSPLIERKQAAAAPKANAEEVEKMPARNASDVASTNAGVSQRSYGNSYDANDNAKAVAKPARAKEAESEIDRIEQGNKLYSQKNYGDALNVYTKEMRGTDSKSRRQAAAVGAARCYTALGNTKKAKEILESIVNEGGPHKREAKRLLKDLE